MDGEEGTAILVKDGLTLSNIQRLPSRRGVLATYICMRIINKYEPSGAERKTERSSFYNEDITHLLPSTPAELILAGYF